MNPIKYRTARAVRAAIAALTGLALAAPAMAQDVFEEIVVTA